MPYEFSDPADVQRKRQRLHVNKIIKMTTQTLKDQHAEIETASKKSIADLQKKLDTSKKKLDTSKKKLDTSEKSNTDLQKRIADLQAQTRANDEWVE